MGLRGLMPLLPDTLWVSGISVSLPKRPRPAPDACTALFLVCLPNAVHSAWGCTLGPRGGHGSCVNCTALGKGGWRFLPSLSTSTLTPTKSPLGNVDGLAAGTPI